MGAKRNAYWDNLKAVLIFLVVLGHFLLPVHSDSGGLIQTVFVWIYVFHMPAFVFVSGIFSKSYVRNDNKEKRIVKFLVVYIIFTSASLLLDMLIHHWFSITRIGRTFFKQGGAPWYMLAMVFWYIVIPYMACFRPALTIPLTIAFGLIAGVFSECGDFLVLSRTIVLFPFFLAGFHFDKDKILSRNTVLKIFGACFLVFCAVLLYCFNTRLNGLLGVFYARSAYEALEFKNGVLMRLLWYFWASCMILSVMSIIPERRLPFTYVGERTLSIYILHRLIRDIVSYLGVYEHLGSKIVLLIEIVLLASATVFISSSKKISDFLNKL